MISDPALREFKEIWLDEFGVEISNEVAIEEAMNLLTMFNAIYRPINREWLEDYENAHGTHHEKPSQAAHACEKVEKEN